MKLWLVKVQLLQSFIRETSDKKAVKASANQTGEGMKCPLTSAKKYLTGPRFTKEAYEQTAKQSRSNHFDL